MENVSTQPVAPVPVVMLPTIPFEPAVRTGLVPQADNAGALLLPTIISSSENQLLVVAVGTSTAVASELKIKLLLPVVREAAAL